MIFLRSTLREFTAAGIGVFIVLLAITFTTQLIRLLGFAARGGVPPDAVLTLLGFSALGYLFVTFYVGMSFPNPEPGAFDMIVYYVYAGVILSGGIIAAIVAGEIRIHVSAALREAELQQQLDQVNHDLDIARSIQQGLLPTTSPKLADFEIAGWNQPADLTGGDYFDWQSLPDGRVAISLADATGHGIGPALVSTSCRAYSRARRRGPIPPAITSPAWRGTGWPSPPPPAPRRTPCSPPWCPRARWPARRCRW